ncbi:MAG: AraC-like DNA-binding protein/ligand-binding sensor protein [Candidatus Latescibacterota bacterium]|jgi:AraC-like DNA-binding protein/ligand-binding sensor protein
MASKNKSPQINIDHLLTQQTFAKLQKAYHKVFGFSLLCVNANGQTIFGKSPCDKCQEDCNDTHKRTLNEALRWGEPCINLCPQEFATWGIPIMLNNQILGGLIVTGVSLENQRNLRKILKASQGLLDLTETHNLTNAAILNQNRLNAKRDNEQAEAMHELREHIYEDIREIYIREEPELLAAIKRGERKKAREIINRVLVGVYFIGRNREDLLKSLILELIVMMSRAAVEAGADPTTILGTNYRALSNLSQIQDEAALSKWVTEMLEDLISTIQNNQTYPHLVLLSAALKYMEQNLSQELTREEVAKIAGMSPGHFSRVIKETTGKTFSEILTGYRIARASQLLVRTSKSLVQIALDCGFTDQSYFSRVFRKSKNCTPNEYRKQHIISR